MSRGRDPPLPLPRTLSSMTAHGPLDRFFGNQSKRVPSPFLVALAWPALPDGCVWGTLGRGAALEDWTKGFGSGPPTPSSSEGDAGRGKAREGRRRYLSFSRESDDTLVAALPTTGRHGHHGRAAQDAHCRCTGGVATPRPCSSVQC